MDDPAAIAWLARRAGFGLTAGELDRRLATGVASYLDELVDPDKAGIAATPDVADGLNFTDSNDQRHNESVALIDHWLASMVAGVRPLEDMMTWFWHHHFAVSITVVKSPRLMAQHLALLRRHALGDFRQLIKDVAIDPAMLLFLDGAKNTVQAPNENFGRELLELYTLGIGNYTETDVRSAAVALTGWTLRPRDNFSAVFDPRRHATTPQTLLGRTVSDVNGVVDVAVDQPACARRIAGKLADWFLGPRVDDALVAAFAATFRSNGMQLKPLVRAILQAGLDGKGAELVLAPVPWLVSAQRALDTRLDTRVALRWMASAGQVPLNPPNVGGWPGASAWLGASSTVARLSLAAALVDGLPATSPLLQAAAAGDVDRLARALGRPTGFSSPTRDALTAASKTSGGRAGATMLAVALASPDLLLA